MFAKGIPLSGRPAIIIPPVKRGLARSASAENRPRPPGSGKARGLALAGRLSAGRADPKWGRKSSSPQRAGSRADSSGKGSWPVLWIGRRLSQSPSGPAPGPIPAGDERSVRPAPRPLYTAGEGEASVGPFHVRREEFGPGARRERSPLFVCRRQGGSLCRLNGSRVFLTRKAPPHHAPERDDRVGQPPPGGSRRPDLPSPPNRRPEAPPPPRPAAACGAGGFCGGGVLLERPPRRKDRMPRRLAGPPATQGAGAGGGREAGGENGWSRPGQASPSLARRGASLSKQIRRRPVSYLDVGGFFPSQKSRGADCKMGRK